MLLYPLGGMMKRKDILGNLDLYRDNLSVACKEYFTLKTGIDVDSEILYLNETEWLETSKFIAEEDDNTFFQYFCSIDGFLAVDTGRIFISHRYGITKPFTKQHNLNKLVGVIMHELAHNVSQEHDDKFYDILTQLGCDVGEFVDEEYRDENWPSLFQLPGSDAKFEVIHENN
jgi:hypothetical protein